MKIKAISSLAGPDSVSDFQLLQLKEVRFLQEIRYSLEKEEARKVSHL
jgi:hypothetical protein